MSRWWFWRNEIIKLRPSIREAHCLLYLKCVYITCMCAVCAQCRHFLTKAVIRQPCLFPFISLHLFYSMALNKNLQLIVLHFHGKMWSWTIEAKSLPIEDVIYLKDVKVKMASRRGQSLLEVVVVVFLLIDKGRGLKITGSNGRPTSVYRAVGTANDNRNPYIITARPDFFSS